MKKTRKELQAVIDEITAICKKHDIVLIGTCISESIRGEITIEDATEPLYYDDLNNDDRELDFSRDGEWSCGVIG